MTDNGDADALADRALKRVIDRMAEGLDNAACVAVTMRFDRDTFVKAAGSAFDFISNCNIILKKEEEEVP